MKKIEIAYLAGIMDADGYFSIKKSTYWARRRANTNRPVFSERVGMKQVCPIVPDLLHSAFGGYRSVQKPSAPNGKPLHGWEVTQRKAAKAVKTLLPYLKIKRQQAKLLVALRASLDRPRAETHVRKPKPTVQNTRAGIQAIYRRHVSDDVLAEREALWVAVKALNDSRSTPNCTMKPLP